MSDVLRIYDVLRTAGVKCEAGSGERLVSVVREVVQKANVSDIDVPKYIAHMLSDTSSALSTYVRKFSQAKVDKEFTVMSRTRRKLYLPIFVAEKDRDVIRTRFPGYYIMFAESGYHEHGLAAAFRYIECNELLCEVVTKVAEGEVVLDIGGNYVPHLIKGVYDVDGCKAVVHSACPCFGIKDSTRETKRRMILRSTLATTRDPAVRQRIRDYLSGDETYRCRMEAAKCNEHASVGISLHSAYDVGLVGLAEIMQVKRMREVVGTFIWDERMRQTEQGMLEELGMWYERKGERVYMGFRDTSVYEYDHDMSILESMTRPAVVRGVDGNYVYSIRRAGPVIYFRMRFVPLVFSAVTPSVAQCYEYRDGADLFWEIYTYCWDGIGKQGLPSSYIRQRMLVEKVMLDMFLAWASLPNVVPTLTREKLYGYLRTLREPIRINSRLFNPSMFINSVECSQLVDFVWLYVYRTKYRRGKTVARYVDRERFRRNVEGSSTAWHLWCAVYSKLLATARTAAVTMQEVYESFGAGALPCDYDEVDGVYFTLVSLLEIGEEVIPVVERVEDEWFYDASDKLEGEDASDGIDIDSGFEDSVSILGADEQCDEKVVGACHGVACDCGVSGCSESSCEVTYEPPIMQLPVIDKDIINADYNADAVVCDYELGLRDRYNNYEKTSILAALSEAARYYRAESEEVIPSTYRLFDMAYGRSPALKRSDNKEYNVVTYDRGQIVKRQFPGKQTYMGGVDVVSKKFIKVSSLRKNQPPVTLFVSEETEVMIADQVARVLEKVARIDVPDIPRAACLKEGVGGCGKTFSLVEAASSTDIIVCSTKATAMEILSMMKEKFGEGYDERNVGTFMSYILNKCSKGKVVRCDEALLEMAGVFWAVVLLTGAEEIYAYGDRCQIMWMNRNRNRQVRFNAYYLWNTTEFDDISRRFPADTAFSARKVYNRKIYTTRPILRSQTLVRASSESEILRYLRFNIKCKCVGDDCKGRTAILTFYRADKYWLQSAGFTAYALEDEEDVKLLTVHQSQGGTYDHVFLVRPHVISKALEKDISQVNVACTRHRISFVYITRGEGDLVVDWIDRGRLAVDDELRSLVVDKK